MCFQDKSIVLKHKVKSLGTFLIPQTGMCPLPQSLSCESLMALMCSENCIWTVLESHLYFLYHQNKTDILDYVLEGDCGKCVCYTLMPINADRTNKVTTSKRRWQMDTTELVNSLLTLPPPLALVLMSDVSHQTQDRLNPSHFLWQNTGTQPRLMLPFSFLFCILFFFSTSFDRIISNQWENKFEGGLAVWQRKTVGERKISDH